MAGAFCRVLGVWFLEVNVMSFSARCYLRSLADSAPIIGVLLATLALGGCSAVHLGYANSPSLVYWWMDRYADFSSEQGTQLRADLQIVHDWHRSMEIPRLVQQLRDLQAMAPKDVTPDQVCRIVDAVQERVQVTLERMVPAVARVAPTVQSAQLSHFSKALEARERKWQEEWLQPPLPERNQHRAKQWLQRLESFYGDLDKAQVALIHAHIPQSSVNPELQLREIQRRHQDILQTFKRVRDKALQKEDTRGELQALLARSLHSPDATYRRYAAQVRQESCQLMSELHKLSSPAQRQHLINTLKSYEIDS